MIAAQKRRGRVVTGCGGFVIAVAIHFLHVWTGKVLQYVVLVVIRLMITFFPQTFSWCMAMIKAVVNRIF